jgi:hypothetical protein
VVRFTPLPRVKPGSGERRFLADLTTMALPPHKQSSVPLGLARADALSAAARQLESLTEVSWVYEAGVEAFEEK